MRAYFTPVAGWLLISATALAQTPTATTKTVAASARPDVTAGILSARAESIAPGRTALTIVTKPDVHFRLLDGTGQEVTATRAPDGALKAEISPDKNYVLAPTASAERRPLPKDGLQFPARYVNVVAGRTNVGGLFLRPAVVPLTWNEQARAYTTEIFVGYEFDDGGERELKWPRTVTFFAEGANARIQADSVMIEQSGGKGYKRVVLSTGQVDGETHFTARAGPADELRSSVNVRREMGALKLSLPSVELPGFGVGSGELTVSLLGRDGMPFAAMQPLEVQLSSRRLRQPAVLVIEAGKNSATADVRTTGHGPDEIVAQSGALRAALPIRQIFPVAATVAALGGGALGGVARYLRNKRKRGPLLARRMVEGVIVGLIIVGATWTGLVSVNLSAGILGTPFGAFVLAALAGYLGCTLLDRVAKKTFGAEKEA